MLQSTPITVKHSGYLQCIFRSVGDLDRTVDFTVRTIKDYTKKKKVGFEFIAVTGTSGLIVGSIVAHKLKKRLIVIRKEKDSFNATCKVEGIPDCNSDYQSKLKKHYIIIDDLIHTGGTIKRIISQIKNHNKDCRCVGICTYNVPAYFWQTNESKYMIGFKEFWSRC